MTRDVCRKTCRLPFSRSSSLSPFFSFGSFVFPSSILLTLALFSLLSFPFSLLFSLLFSIALSLSYLDRSGAGSRRIGDGDVDNSAAVDRERQLNGESGAEGRVLFAERELDVGVRDLVFVLFRVFVYNNGSDKIGEEKEKK